jgi:predicted NodU family carbamoyl transferase
LNGSEPGVKFSHNLHKGANWYKPELYTKNDLARLANATQFVFELMVKSTSKWCLQNLPSHNLILTGGCALNKVAVDGIEKKWNYIYVPKNPGDPGSCIGAVLALNNKHIDFDEKIWYNKV